MAMQKATSLIKQTIRGEFILNLNTNVKKIAFRLKLKQKKLIRKAKNIA